MCIRDRTNIDSVGIVTARDHIKIITDNKRLSLGASEDFRLYHDGTYNKIDNAGTTDLFITVNNYGEYAAKFKANNSVDLFYDGTKKFETSSTGINITGTVTATGADINGDLDVDGHTNLDNVSIAGVVTATSFATDGGHMYITNAMPALYFTDTNNNPDWRIQNVNGTLSFIDATNSVHRIEINTVGNVSFSNDLDVDGHTNLDNVSIAGVSTFTGNVYIADSIVHAGDTNTYLQFPTGDAFNITTCLLYTSPSPRDLSTSRMPSSA